MNFLLCRTIMKFVRFVFRHNVGTAPLQPRSINATLQRIAGSSGNLLLVVKVVSAQGLRDGLAPRGPTELFGLGEPRSPEPSSHQSHSHQQQPTLWSPIGGGGVGVGGGQQQVFNSTIISPSNFIHGPIGLPIFH